MLAAFLGLAVCPAGFWNVDLYITKSRVSNCRSPKMIHSYPQYLSRPHRKTSVDRSPAYRRVQSRGSSRSSRSSRSRALAIRTKPRRRAMPVLSPHSSVANVAPVSRSKQHSSSSKTPRLTLIPPNPSPSHHSFASQAGRSLHISSIIHLISSRPSHSRNPQSPIPPPSHHHTHHTPPTKEEKKEPNSPS